MDRLTPERRSENMRRIKSKNMKPEMVVRRLAHSLGYRFRLHRKDLPGKPDLTFPSRQKIIFVHGCFWHQHDPDTCSDGRLPKSNTEYWQEKLRKNTERDERQLDELNGMGWDVLVVWECETGDEDSLRGTLTAFLG